MKRLVILSRPHPARRDGSYESSTEERWPPGEIRAIDPTRADELLADFPGIFELVGSSAQEAPAAPEPPEDTEAAPTLQNPPWAGQDVVAPRRRGRPRRGG